MGIYFGEKHKIDFLVIVQLVQKLGTQPSEWARSMFSKGEWGLFWPPCIKVVRRALSSFVNV